MYFLKKSNHLVLSLGLSIALCECLQITISATPTSLSCLLFLLFCLHLPTGQEAELSVFLSKLRCVRERFPALSIFWNKHSQAYVGIHVAWYLLPETPSSYIIHLTDYTVICILSIHFQHPIREKILFIPKHRFVNPK